MTRVEKSILVNVPVSVAYNQWTQFEEFPNFMGGVQSVTQLTEDRLQWVAEIGGVKRQWEARILEQVPDRKVAWAATEGATNAGEVSFQDMGAGQTSVRLVLEYEPEGLIEKVGDKLNFIERQVTSDLEKFKFFIESEGYATGAWRGSVNEGAQAGAPTVEHAAASRGDSGKAGISGKAVAAGLGVAAAVAAAATSASKRSDESQTETTAETTTFREVGRTAPAATTTTASTTETTVEPAPLADAPTASMDDVPAVDLTGVEDRASTGPRKDDRTI
ncbi:polyketide cyclase/dehydrase/lipid transport protein [Kineococcus xinjiangensis]|uniref:Polyketide cyclase/dehydrase/lipid transport protein n=1 Tax=Kineococcus xinjiangensis TaxID=512762 RepID=A0A2S6IIS7_9ACTN|nr:SRPBCC family protein [Kineococcus xinjiangensis]PPK94119.1 polyketide cyclase/dehydrase/lipid transport protein [Kineococcus xinjiangensis]